MDNIWGFDIAYAPDRWPYWLMLVGMLIVAVLAALVLHGVLRFMLRPKTTEPQTEHKLYLYPGTIRAWHWCNALLFILLLLSGVLNHFSIGPTAQMVMLHEICGFALIMSWVAFIVLNKSTSNSKHYRIHWRDWPKRCVKQVYFYLFGIMKGESHPFPANEQSKFNPIQQVTYLAVMYGLVPLLSLSGLGCLYPHITGQGFWLFRLHQILAIASLIFIMIHVYLCTTGDTPTQTFKSMVDGYHRHNEHGPQTSADK